MKFLRASLIALTLSAITVGVGYSRYGVANVPANEPAAACARCGDGQCQKSCGENAVTCPRDCGVPQESSR